MRNLFFDVFGLESTSYPKERNHNPNKIYNVTKTHMRPCEIADLQDEDFVIYIVRDGRDSIVSNAHYRRNFIEPNSCLYENIKENILAQEGSYFGGWSTNAMEWHRRANLIFRFEDLIENPILLLEQLRKYIDLPDPQYSKIKSFEELKFGEPRYGSGGQGIDRKAFAENFFHKGAAGQFIDEMPTDLQNLYWHYHGDLMSHFGYLKIGGRMPYNFDPNLSLERSIPLESKLIITYYYAKSKLKNLKNLLMPKKRPWNLIKIAP